MLARTTACHEWQAQTFKAARRREQKENAPDWVRYDGTLNHFAGLCPAHLKKVLMPERHHFALQKSTSFSAAASCGADGDERKGGRGPAAAEPRTKRKRECFGTPFCVWLVLSI